MVKRELTDMGTANRDKDNPATQQPTLSPSGGRGVLFVRLGNDD